MAYTATGKGWFKDWIDGEGVPVGFIMQITQASGTVRYLQMFESPGYRKLPSNAYAPYFSFSEPFSISVLNESQGEPDPETGRVLFDQFRMAQLQDGSFVVSNQNGEVTSWVSEVWSDAAAILYVGPIDTAYATIQAHGEFFSFLVAEEPTWAMGGTGPHELRFRIKPSSLNLNLPAAVAKFAGTGGLEGGDNAEGIDKPRLFGRVVQMRPFAVDASNERYLISTAAIDSIQEVYEKGHPVGSSRYTTTLASGYFDLNNTATYEPVTCDAKGEKIDGGAWTGDAGKIIQYLVGTLWGGSIDSGSVTAYSAAIPHVVGVYFDPAKNGETRGAVLDFLLSPLGILRPILGSSSLYLQMVEAPESKSGGSLTFAYDDSHIVSCETLALAHPAWQVYVSYAERFAQSDSLAEAMADREYLSRSRSYVKKEDASVKATYKNALSMELRTALFAETGADSLATSALALLKVKRSVFRVRLASDPFASGVGEYGTIQHPSYPEISSAKKVLQVGWQFDLERRQIDPLFWG